MRPRRESDDFDDTAAELGLSIVEVIVALMLLGIGILGTSASFISSGRATTNALQRSQASQLAVAEIEQVRTVPYTEVGMDTTAADYQVSYAGRTTVEISASTPATSTLQPLTFIAIDGVAYEIRIHLTWQPIVVNGNSVDQGYKVINVIARWTDSAGSHDVELDSGLYDRSSG